MTRFKLGIIIILVTFAYYIIPTFSARANMRPTTLKRLPLLTTDNETIWEWTKIETMIRTNGKRLIDAPYGLDVKNIEGTNSSLIAITDAHWCSLMLFQSTFDLEQENRSSTIRGFGKWGNAENRFKFPVGIEIGGYNDQFDPQLDFIFIADAGNGRIVKLSYNYDENMAYWSYDFGHEYLSSPRGLAYRDKGTESRADDELLVADMENSRIIRFSVDGIFLGSYGETGFNPGQLITPMGLCLGRPGTPWENYLYVTDTYNYKICLFEIDNNGLTFIDEIRFDGYPRSELMGITADYEGFIYVADRTRNRIIKLDPLIHQVGIVNEETGGLDFSFNEPQVVRFYDGTLTVVNKYSETSGFMCFGVPYTDTLAFDEDWGGMGGAHSVTLIILIRMRLGLRKTD